MRLLVSIAAILLLTGCTAMLVSGSGSYDKSDECEQTEKEGDKREC
jgi:outer membrane biogenesis lipoprotein LolB